MAPKLRELYISTDIETLGMSAPLHSMIQLGSVVVDSDGNLTGQEFTDNLKPLPESVPLESTMRFWDRFPEVYKKVTESPREPEEVMLRYRAWLESLEGDLIFTGYPVTFDYSFVWYYLWRFTGGCPFTHGALDIKTLAMSLLNSTYNDAAKKYWPQGWLPPEGIHAHVALDDAREQGYEFGKMLKELRLSR